MFSLVPFKSTSRSFSLSSLPYRSSIAYSARHPRTHSNKFSFYSSDSPSMFTFGVRFALLHDFPIISRGWQLLWTYCINIATNFYDLVPYRPLTLLSPYWLFILATLSILLCECPKPWSFGPCFSPTIARFPPTPHLAHKTADRAKEPINPPENLVRVNPP